MTAPALALHLDRLQTAAQAALAGIFARYIQAHGVQLHPHHDVCSTSIECIVCPANLSAEKLRLLERLHPEAAAGIRHRARFALSLAAAKANEMIGVLDGTGLAAREIQR